MKVTRLGPARTLLSATSLGGSGGTLDPAVGSGLVPTASGSNSWAWGSNVSLISANGSNGLLGPFVSFASGSGITLAVSSNTMTITSTGSVEASLGWFNTTTYGATNDGTTDDTAAINLAIAALNTAGRGVLYFPAGAGYKVTAALTAITAVALIRGDGSPSFDYAVWGSSIICTSATAVLFTISGKAARFEGLGIIRSGVASSAGTAILVDSAYIHQRCDFVNLHVRGFYDGIDVKVGAHWEMNGVVVTAPVRYGVRIRNTVNADAGDWSISNCHFNADTQNATSAIRVESSGGGKISNTKINTGYPALFYFVTGIDVAITTGAVTSVMAISNNSIENVTGDAIKIDVTGTGKYGLFAIDGNEVALWGNNTGRAVNLSAVSTGGHNTAGGLGSVTIDGLVAATNGTARAAVSLTNTDNVVLGEIALYGFTSRYTGSGDTNTSDGGGGGAPTTADYLVGTAQAGLSAEIVVGATPGGELGGTWASPTVDATHSGSAHHTHATGAGEVLVSDTPIGSPLVFADLIQNEAQNDLLHSDL